MPPRKRSVTQHSTSRPPKGELSTLDRAAYYDKWLALRRWVEDLDQDESPWQLIKKMEELER